MALCPPGQRESDEIPARPTRAGLRARKDTLMRTILQGGLAGLLAGLITSLFWFVDYGPGNSLHTVAHWLMLDSSGAGKQVGFLLLLVLGGLFGLLFGATVRAWRSTLGGFLLRGLVIGAVYWLLVAFLFGKLVFHGSLD